MMASGEKKQQQKKPNPSWYLAFLLPQQIFHFLRPATSLGHWSLLDYLSKTGCTVSTARLYKILTQGCSELKTFLHSYTQRITTKLTELNPNPKVKITLNQQICTHKAGWPGATMVRWLPLSPHSRKASELFLCGACVSSLWVWQVHDCLSPSCIERRQVTTWTGHQSIAGLTHTVKQPFTFTNLWAI